MGAALWATAGVAGFVVARIVPLRRTPRFMPELLVSVVMAVIFGVIATALDFGGWNEPDWRAGLFALLGSLAALGIARSVAEPQ